MVDKDGNTQPYDMADEDFEGVGTKREYLFGGLYQKLAENIRSGKTKPKHYPCETTAELCDFDEVIHTLVKRKRQRKQHRI